MKHVSLTVDDIDEIRFGDDFRIASHTQGHSEGLQHSEMPVLGHYVLPFFFND